MVSLALLLTHPRKLDLSTVRAAAGRAFGRVFLADKSQRYFVVQEREHFAVRHGSQFLGVLCGSEPYWADAKVTENVGGDPAVAGAVRAHKGWIAVDSFGTEDNEEVPPEHRGEVYRMLARLARELLAEDCLALVVPESRRIIAIDEQTRALLGAQDPMQWLVPGPVVLEGAHPMVLAAEAEARRRFPEFLESFENRPHDDPGHWIKAPFTDSHGTEQMWVEVGAIEHGVVYGRLQSEPKYVRCVKTGQYVRVRMEQVTDFMFHRGQEAVGGFTDKAIRQISESDGQPGQ